MHGHLEAAFWIGQALYDAVISKQLHYYSMILTYSISNLKPGGKIEISDCRAKFFCDDDTWPDDSYMRKWTVRSISSS